MRTPARLRSDAAAQAAFAALDLDAAVVAAYGLILPQAMLDAPRRGCLNIHASLLPRWRGAAPIQAAILAGDAETGITIMQMDAGLDTGPMLLREAVPIAAHDHRRRHCMTCWPRSGARLILRALDERPAPVPQPAEGATYAAEADPRGRADRLDAATRRRSTGRCGRSIPGPARSPRCGGAVLKVLAAEPADGRGRAGHGAGRRADGGLRRRRAAADRACSCAGRAAMAADGFPARPSGARPARVLGLIADRRMTRWALLLEYDGGPFVGWQRQATGLSVQEVLESRGGAAEPRRSPSPASSPGAPMPACMPRARSRSSTCRRRCRRRQVRDALNFHMKPHPVVVLQAAPAPEGWNARFSAIGRAYRYRILNRRARPALLAGRVWHVAAPLDAAAMHEAAQTPARAGTISPRSAPPPARPKARCARSTGWTCGATAS